MPIHDRPQRDTHDSIEVTQHVVSIKGTRRLLPALIVDGTVVVIGGRALRIAEVFDEYWLERDRVPEPDLLVARLAALSRRPDIFAFTQRVPDLATRLPYRYELDNVAAVRISTYDYWLRHQISSACRRNVKSSEKKGVTVRVCEFDQDYIRGIMSISDESPIRANRRYWHYGKDFETVQREQGTYASRATFLGAFVDDEMVGYLKLVWDKETAAIMQIVSKLSHRERRPNNALLAYAVKECADRGVGHLLYERFVYGDNLESSLTRFKRENGFERFDIPRYYAPLTLKGRVALRLGLHRPVSKLVPHRLRRALVDLRTSWYRRGEPVAAATPPD